MEPVPICVEWGHRPRCCFTVTRLIAKIKVLWSTFFKLSLRRARVSNFQMKNTPLAVKSETIISHKTIFLPAADGNNQLIFAPNRYTVQQNETVRVSRITSRKSLNDSIPFEWTRSSVLFWKASGVYTSQRRRVGFSRFHSLLRLFLSRQRRRARFEIHRDAVQFYFGCSIYFNSFP